MGRLIPEFVNEGLIETKKRGEGVRDCRFGRVFSLKITDLTKKNSARKKKKKIHQNS